MIKVVIIGSGNVAFHLLRAFASSTQVEVIQLFSRNKEKNHLQFDSNKIVNNYDNISDADLYIIAVSDIAIAEVSACLPFTNKLVVHTSGTASIHALNEKNRKGVFYPLQTFSKNRPLNFKEIPICLETENQTDLLVLQKVGQAISGKIVEINKHQRKSLHVAAVFVNNFVNEMYRIGNDICTENKISFDLLKPLIIESAHKILTLSPEEAQTGPALRGDIDTIQSHLEFISNENESTIYSLLTQSIQNHGKKL